MSLLERPQGELFSKWRFPARYIAHPKLIDGTAGDDWPLCETHMPFAMVAGWFPIDEIPPTPSSSTRS